ncbi:MAG: acyl carrier protein [Gammaproteobacteria bacterium]|nr:acyl carrier protein [Gammaproteobacteria bacterium]MDH3412292.1 acyl carrier protein [Gammaproteobacteria bacterium]
MSDRLSPNEVSERVVSITSEVLSLDEPPKLESDLRKDLNADSLDLLTLFMTLEDEFGGSIPEEEAGKISTLRDIVEYVNGRIAAEQPEC